MYKILIPAVAALCLGTSAFAQWGTPAPAATATPVKAETASPAAGAAVENIDALQKAVTDAWEKMPLGTRHVMFVGEKPANFGAWSGRPTNVFKAGEKLMTYVEPVGYVWTPKGDMYDFGVGVDFIVKSADGAVLGGQENFTKLVLSSHAKLQEMMLTLTLSLDQIKPGKYILEYKLHDNGSDKVATTSQPFTISD